jgi:hypothetical protein
MKKVAIVVVDTYPMNNLVRHAINETSKLSCVSAIYTFAKNPIVQGEFFHAIDGITSSSKYSDFVINVLPYFVKEEYALVIQWDGFCINPSLWTNDFLNYDFIGSPWPGQTSDLAVGNGGFSLRSQKFMRAGKNLKIIPDDTSEFMQAEDQLLCRVYRDRLLETGIQFGNLEIANKFSYESLPLTSTMGFHGAFNLPRVMSEEALIENIDEIILRISGASIMAMLIYNAFTLRKLTFATDLINKIRNTPNKNSAVKTAFLGLNKPEFSNLFI